MSTLNEALADELQRQGVNLVFGLLGDDVVQFGVELQSRGIEFRSSRHESAAIAMADGYARASGKLGVALVSRGPGVANAFTGLVTAGKAANPVLVLTTDSDPSSRGSVFSKWIDQRTVFEAADVPVVTITSPDSAVADLGEAVEWARHGKPIVAQFQGDILEATAGSAPTSAVIPARQPSAGAPDPDQITMIADLLQESWAFAHPVILGGRGAHRADARQQLQRLADQIGGVLATTLMAKSMFDGDPFNVGIAGTFSSEYAVELFRLADVVLVFGASLHPLTTVHGTLFPHARAFRFDRDPRQSERGSMPAELFVASDARLAAQALADELEQRGHRAVGFRTDMIRERIASSLSPTIHDAGSRGALDPRLVMTRLNEMLPAERTLVLDNGHHWFFSTAYLDVPDPGALVAPMEFQCVGAATGMAVGAALARPDRTTVLCTGDCASLMTLGDLESIARHELPVLVVVINDGGLGAEFQYLRALDLEDSIAHEPTPSFADVARALGFDAYAIQTLDDLTALAGVVGDVKRPTLLEIPVTTEVRAEWLEEIMIGRRREEVAS